MSSLTVPLSIRLISRISLIRLSRCWPDTLIFFRYSLTRSMLSICAVARAVNPIMAFIGVRISCDILFRNTVLALLACSAAASASRRASSCFCSRRFSSVASRVATNTAVTLPSASFRLWCDQRKDPFSVDSTETQEPKRCDPSDVRPLSSCPQRRDTPHGMAPR